MLSSTLKQKCRLQKCGYKIIASNSVPKRADEKDVVFHDVFQSLRKQMESLGEEFDLLRKEHWDQLESLNRRMTIVESKIEQLKFSPLGAEEKKKKHPHFHDYIGDNTYVEYDHDYVVE